MSTTVYADSLNATIRVAKTIMPSQTSAAVPETSSTQYTTSDVVDISKIASSLSSDVLRLFNSFSNEDQTRLADLVDRGVLSGQELNDGLTASLKSNRKLQLWNLVAEKNSSFPTKAGIHSPGVAEIEKHGEDSLEESGRIFREMGQLLGKSGAGAEAEQKALAERLQKLSEKSREFASVALTDITKPMTFIGASGKFFSANWVTGIETAASEKLASLGVISADMIQAIKEDAKKAAGASLLINGIN